MISVGAKATGDRAAAVPVGCMALLSLPRALAGGGAEAETFAHLYASTLTLVFSLTGLIAASGESLSQAVTSSVMEPTSTCWLTCFSLNPPGVTRYKTFHVTEDACCSGSALSCPPGSTPSQPAWGEPAELCRLAVE